MIAMHDRLREGLPYATAAYLRKQLQLIGDDQKVMSALGLRRRRHGPSKWVLTTDRSNCVWRFARLLACAIYVLGDQPAAERWMIRPSTALDRRAPVDLLKTSVGALMVYEHLTRMQFGVYA